jgi:membrane protease subunit HflK
MVQEATAYKQGKILAAQGQVSKFEQLLPEYKLAPKVTKDRLYLETMEQVYSNTTKIIVNTSGSGNMMYLPLDKIMQQQKQTNKNASGTRENVNYNTGSGNTTQPTQSTTNSSSRSDRFNDGRN